MIPNEDNKTNHDYPHHTRQTDEAPAGGYRVNDDKNLEEKDLKKTFLFGDSKMDNPDTPGHESHGMGGHKFGENNVTPAGDDEFNPSQTAGYDNEYFRRKEPMEEHPEYSNFRADERNRQPYQEGTSDNDGKGATHPGLKGNKEDVDDLRISTKDYMPPTAGNTNVGAATSVAPMNSGINQPNRNEMNRSMPGQPDYGGNTLDDEKEHIET